MSNMNLVIVWILILGFLTPTQAVEPDEILSEPALEERARELSAKLRCLVCQNQSIDDSDAPLAKDLRILVRQKLVEGSSNVEVLDFVVSKYGEFVLLQPRFALHTLLLWLLPPIIVLIGILTIILRYKLQQKYPLANSEAGLTTEEELKLKQVLDNDAKTNSN